MEIGDGRFGIVDFWAVFVFHGVVDDDVIGIFDDGYFFFFGFIFFGAFVECTHDFDPTGFALFEDKCFDGVLSEGGDEYDGSMYGKAHDESSDEGAFEVLGDGDDGRSKKYRGVVVSIAEDEVEVWG